MILIGQYNSPFVRRVGVALTLYGLAFEHRPWSVFGETERIRPLNPLVRVPTLVLDDGEVLLDSHMILDCLDGSAPAGQAMFPRVEPARHRSLRIAALATGIAEKAVSLFYEKRLHETVSTVWVERCGAQIAAVLAVLEADRAARPEPYWFGPRMGHEDVALTCALRFIGEAHPGLVALADYPTLARHAAGMEALPVFQAISQPFIPPA